MDEAPAYGTRVRFTAESLGMIDPSASGTQFVEETLGPNDEGEVVTQPGQMPEGWVAVRPDRFPQYLAPVHPRMIEPLRTQAGA